VHPISAKASNRVKPLLVGHDQYDIWLCHQFLPPDSPSIINIDHHV
jgi:hypothetical protein